MIKKFLSLLLCLTLLAGLAAGCAPKPPEEPADDPAEALSGDAYQLRAAVLCPSGSDDTALIGWLYGLWFVEEAFPDRSIAWVTAVICGVGAVMSMVGDLAASAIKRNRDIKDYGKLIPGHGGIMDRFDSTIVTAPIIYFLTILMLL